jgi:GrpB-like predicted nucleotidyltransferase (UPF0157 family)
MDSLGVQKGKVKLVDFNPKWTTFFAAEQIRLANLLGLKSERIVHFGSTSIKNCKSKPIIDIAIPFEKLVDTRKAVSLLLTSEYGLNNIYYLCDRVCFSKGDPQTHLLYLINKDSPVYINWITFKEMLNSDDSLVQRYNDLKTTLCALHQNSRVTYTEMKTDFIYETLNQNNQWQMKMSTLQLR